MSIVEMPLEKKYTIDAAWMSLPESEHYGGYLCRYKMYVKDGFFSDSIQALIQCKFDNQQLTLTAVGESGFLCSDEVTYYLHTPCFNDFHTELFDSLPDKIRHKYRHLALMANPHRILPNDPRRIPEDGYVSRIIPELGLFFSQSRGSDDMSGFIFDTREGISDKRLSKNQVWEIGQVCQFIVKARAEYQRFKATRLYRVLQDKLREARASSANAITLLTLFKLAKLGYSLYSGLSSSDDYTGWGGTDVADLNIDFGNDDYMADYLCADVNTDFSGYDGGDQTSWTGSFTGGDKYTDNAYNQAQYDKWMDIYQQKLAKGDSSGAASALSTAKDHLRRIKN